jgi:tol-pal system protein YbgF
MLKSENDRLKSENQDLMNREPEVKVVYKSSNENIEDYAYAYEDALSLFKQRKYAQAAEEFEKLIALSHSHKLSDNAQYWIGECHYALKKYSEAILDFEKVFTYKNSNKRADSQFKLGLSYYQLKDYQNAKLEFQRFIEKYPNNRNVSRAQSFIAGL